MGFKRGFIFWICLVGGIVLGGVLTEVAQRVYFLNFLTWGKSIGIGADHPLVVDLSVVKLTLGFTVEMNLAILICLLLSLLFYHSVGKKI